MSKRNPTGKAPAQMTGVDHLFGRDLRQGGWFVDENLVAGSRRRPSLRSDDRPGDTGPDPAVIWALRNRRRG